MRPRQKVMFALSPFLLYIPNVIAKSTSSSSLFKNNHALPTYQLLHFPETLQSYCSNAIFIYMWFYFLLCTPVYYSLYKFICCSSICNITHYLHAIKPSNTTGNLYSSLYMYIYILFNLCLTKAVHNKTIRFCSL